MKHDQNSNLEKYSDAVSHIDEDILESALMERHRMLEGRRTAKSARNLGRLCRISAAAACLALAVSIPAFALGLRQSDRPVEPARSNPASGTEPTVTADATAKVTTSFHPGTGATTLPEYTPPFDMPSMEEIYQIEPFNQLFPKNGFDKLQFTSSYQILPDEILGDNIYLETNFNLPSDSSESLTVRISDLGNWRPEQIYDPTKNYIGPNKLIPSEYLTVEVVDQLYFVLSDPELNYRYFFHIFLLCEYEDVEYEVEYLYCGNGFTPEMLYELITSAPCFDSIKSTE